MARFAVRKGNAHEPRTVSPLIAELSVGKMVADKLYDSKSMRGLLANRGIDAVIPPQRNRWRNPPTADMDAYKARHLVENAFADIKHFRGIATRYCKLAETFTALVALVCFVVNTRATRRGPSPYA